MIMLQRHGGFRYDDTRRMSPPELMYWLKKVRTVLDRERQASGD
jgi:hypothetical protein